MVHIHIYKGNKNNLVALELLMTELQRNITTVTILSTTQTRKKQVEVSYKSRLLSVALSPKRTLS